MNQVEPSDADLPSRYLSLQKELSALAHYIDETRRTLGGVKAKLPTASDALAGVSDATEKATHGILDLVEQLMERDGEMAEALDQLEATAPSAKEAVGLLRDAADERMMKLTEMMTELSFQDLTCQAIQKISATILEIEKRLIALIEPVDGDDRRVGDRPETRFSGLERLEETSRGDSRQDLIDELLSQRTTGC